MKWKEKDIECLFRLYSSCKRNYEASNIQWLGCLVKFVESYFNQLEMDEKELVELYYFQDHSLNINVNLKMYSFDHLRMYNIDHINTCCSRR